MKVGGVVLEKNYPYCTDGSSAHSWCDPCSPVGYNKTMCGPGLKPPACNSTLKCRDNLPKAAHIDNWKAISTNETEIASVLT